MNNAANTIDAKSKSLRDLLKERRYKLGYFQREYKWERDNVEDLIIDLERSFFSNYDITHSQENVANYDKYYMGPIVLYQEEAEFSIVDGQQRLTSFTLLLIYLNHLQDEVLKQKGKLNEYIYSEFYGKNGYNLNIDERITVLDFLYTGRQINSDQLPTNESCLNLIERYVDIEELFPTRLKARQILPLFVNWITEKLVFIEILTQTSESAYTIFETMNDRGLNLTPTEMLKSFLLSKAKDEDKIRELDLIWKSKISRLKGFSTEEDLDFFRAWFRGKYAITIRTSEKGSINEDFEKIGTRFHNWIQEKHDKLLELKNPSDFYHFVKSDFQFFSDVYIKLLSEERAPEVAENTLKLISYKGISQSLSFPLILAPLQKTDDEETLNTKIDLVINFIDSLGIFRLLLNEPITHSSIRNSLYIKVKDIRNIELDDLKSRFKKEIEELQKKFDLETDYIQFNSSYAKYLLARIFKNANVSIPFENIFFQRRKDSYVLYQFFSQSDVEAEVHKMHTALKDLIIQSLSSFCLIPRMDLIEIEKMPISKRINHLISNKLINEFNDPKEFDPQNLKDFFVERNKRMKQNIISKWKI